MKDYLILLFDFICAVVFLTPVIDLAFNWWTKGRSSIFLDLTKRGDNDNNKGV